MANPLTLTVTSPTPARATKAAETQLIAHAQEIAAIQVRSAGGAATTGNILDDGATVVGSWTYTPVATS